MPRPFTLPTNCQFPPAIPEQVSPETLQAILLAAGAIARADGAADPREGRALLAFLREHGILARHGRAAISAAYEARIAGRRRSLADAADELAALGGLAGTAAAPLIAAAAAHVARADGVAWPQEVALLAVIRDRLGIRAGRAPA